MQAQITYFYHCMQYLANKILHDTQPETIHFSTPNMLSGTAVPYKLRSSVKPVMAAEPAMAQSSLKKGHKQKG